MYALLAKLYLNAEVYGAPARYPDVVRMADSVQANTNYALDARYRDIFLPNNGPQIRGNHLRHSLRPADSRQPVHALRLLLLPGAGLRLQRGPEHCHEHHARVLRPLQPARRCPHHHLAGGPAVRARRRRRLHRHAGVLSQHHHPNRHQPGADAGAAQAHGRGQHPGHAVGRRPLHQVLPRPGHHPGHPACNGNDVPLLRLADVLLMKAEAILRGATATASNGEMQTPLLLVNKVRARARARRPPALPWAACSTSAPAS
ncbi:MAG: RagB/SusD family nutrient uptake outer membrane protein [Hymenobacter sp.]